MRDKELNIAKNLKYGCYQCGFATMVYKFFNKKFQTEQLKMKISKILEYYQNIRNFKKRKVHSTFIDNIWGADLADMQLVSKFNEGFRFLLCVIDIYSKHALVIPLKDKKGITINNAFQKYLDELKHKPYKIWIDKGSEFYNRSMKSWLEEKDLEMIQHIMKKIDSNKEFDNKDCKSRIGDIARMSKYENIFARGYVLNLSDLKNLKILCRRNFFITDFEGKENFETFYEKEYQETNQKVLRV